MVVVVAAAGVPAMVTPDMVRVAWGQPTEIVSQSRPGDEIWVYQRGGHEAFGDAAAEDVRNPLGGAGASQEGAVVGKSRQFGGKALDTYHTVELTLSMVEGTYYVPLASGPSAH